MKITPKKYAQALADSLEKTQDIPHTIRNFLTVVRKRRNFRLLPKIVSAFENEWSARKGILNMTVVYPEKFESNIPEFEKSLETILGKTVRMRTKSSPGLLGGYRIKAGEILMDSSLQTKLTQIFN